MHLTGPYQKPMGFGAMTIDDGRAYGTLPVRKATASLRFDGRGIRLDGISADIGSGNAGITGAAFIGFGDSTYSFNLAGRGIPVDNFSAAKFKQIAATGVAEFTASGSGTFDVPRNDFKVRVADLNVGGESVGEVTATLALRGNELSGDINAASPRLALTGAGRIALTPQADCELSFRFHDSSLDPYVRLFLPEPLALHDGGDERIGAGGRRAGGPRSPAGRRDGRLARHEAVRLRAAQCGADSHHARSADDRHPESADSSASTRSCRCWDAWACATSASRCRRRATRTSASCRASSATCAARAALSCARSVDGPLRKPSFSGSAIITNGRIRHLSLPNALDTINGAIRFDSRGIQLDEVTASMGGGPIQFGGRIGLEGYLPGELNVVVSGQDMHLRYPEGIQSIVDADLTLRGNVKAPVIGGVVNVQSAVWTRRLDAPGSIFDLASRDRVDR